MAERIVLVVDDESSVLELIGRMLRRGGYAVVGYSQPEAALGWLDDHPGQASLVISDVVMPGMSGLELADAVRQRTPDMPILLVSGYPDRVPRTVVGPATPLLQKPFTPVQLLDAVRKLVGD